MGKYVYSMPGEKIVSRRRRLFNRFMVGFFICLPIFGFMTSMVFIDMFATSVYCAKHIPNSKVKEPELVMLMDNLEIINPPKIDGIEYDYDGRNLIVNYNFPGKQLRNFSEAVGGYDYGDSEGIDYHFDYNFSLITAYQENENATYNDVTNQVDTTKVVKEIHETVRPVLDHARKQPPFPGIQSLFNWYYYNRFN